MIVSADRVLNKIEKVMFFIAGFVCILVTLIIVTDVFLRFIFNHPLPATWEISEVLMPFIIFYAFAYTLTIDAHIRVKILTERVPPKLQFWLFIIGNSISFAICALLAFYSFRLFWRSFIIREEMYAAIKIPWWIGKSAMPVGMVMLMIRYLMQMIQSFKNRKLE